MRVALTVGGRVVGFAGSAVLALYAGLLAADEVLFHGFSAICGDGSPEFDPAYCGITWTPGLPYVGACVLGLVLAAAFAWDRTLTRLVLGATGAGAVVVAVYLWWVTTWHPVNPQHPEPPGPQAVLLAAGATAVLAAVRLRPRERHVAPEPVDRNSERAGR